MRAVTVSDMQAAEEAARAAGVTEEQLLWAAGRELGHAIARQFPQAGHAVAYLGKGHNAGDALVALQVLRDHYGWRVGARAAFGIEAWAPLVRAVGQALAPAEWLSAAPTPPPDGRPRVLLDGLVGLGSRGGLREPLARMAREIAHLRCQHGALVAAVDLPSGVDPDSGEAAGPHVTADATFLIANAKAGLLTARAADAAGALVLVPLAILSRPGSSDFEGIFPQTLGFGKEPRPFDCHKGMAGRVSIVAGSSAYPGAAVLAALGALRGGAGLVTLHVPAECVAAVVPRCPPEVIVHAIDSPRAALATRADAWVVGCGLGTLPAPGAEALLDLIRSAELPSVLDADALNAIARRGAHGLLREHHVLTPHPGEFARLAPDLAEYPREEAARRFARRVPATLLLKGGRSLIARGERALRVNSTGHPGMAGGGQGDLLAGVLGARLAAGLEPVDAASQAAWLCGRASERAIHHHGESAESLDASATARHLGGAFLDWCRASR